MATAWLAALGVLLATLSSSWPSEARILKDFNEESLGKAPSAYDVLVAHGLPIGLLPDNVASYDLQSDGGFTLHLKGACSTIITAEDDEVPVYYAKSISGKLEDHALTNLSGIKTKVVFWLPVTSIHAEAKPDGDISFAVGLLSKTLPASAFTQPQTCARVASFSGLWKYWERAFSVGAKASS